MEHKPPKIQAEVLKSKLNQPDQDAGEGATILLDPSSAEKDHTFDVPKALPILPLRELVVFPGTFVPLGVKRPKSRRLLEEHLPHSKIIGVVTQKEAETEEPGPDDLHEVGAAVLVHKLLRQADESLTIIVQGLRRFKIKRFTQQKPYLLAEITPLEESRTALDSKEWEATVKNLRDSAIELIELTPNIPDQVRTVIMNIEDPGHLADFLGGNLGIQTAKKQEILRQTDVTHRVRMVQESVSSQLEILRLQQKLQKDVESQISDTQRRAYLREQIKAIQRELGEEGEGSEEQMEQLRTRLQEANPPKEVMTQAERELKRLNVIPPASPEYSVIVSYLETIAELPWAKLSKDNLDLNKAQEILDRDHHDLDKVKRRLIEYLAVRKLNPEGRGPILCLLGPPGVGKTSLGQSIADALGREFSRMSLGGIRDEAEIRGHRRTYIGAMPGRIIQEMRRVGTRNPVLMLDEVDKLGADFRGDPASALLEVLDPRQNVAFVDRYLDVPFDLSQVIFISTANYMDPVPPALRDRMEVIEIPGYTDTEKLQIARNYLIKRQLKENGLKASQCKWKVPAIRKIISEYTHEAGVRELERQIGAVLRAVAAEVAKGKKNQVSITPDQVRKFLGPARYVHETKLKTSKPGVVTALAFTPVGGEILHVEATQYPGKGNFTLTGQIGEVMKESIQAAMSLVRSRAKPLGISNDLFKETDVHLHVPSGAVPKDGPSAGVAMFTAIASLYSDIPVSNDVAMTGEITLRGLVLPVGGLKEKSLAAMRAGIKRVIVPKLNEKDLPELPKEVTRKIKFIPVESVDEVLEAALTKGKRKAKGKKKSAALRAGRVRNR